MKSVAYNVERPPYSNDFVTCRSMDEVAKLVGVNWNTVQYWLKGKDVFYANGYRVVKMKRVVKEVERNHHGVLVFTKDGGVLRFRNRIECAKAMGVDASTISRRLADGKADRNGNCYDKP